MYLKHFIDRAEIPESTSCGDSAAVSALQTFGHHVFVIGKEFWR